MKVSLEFLNSNSSCQLVVADSIGGGGSRSVSTHDIAALIGSLVTISLIPVSKRSASDLFSTCKSLNSTDISPFNMWTRRWFFMVGQVWIKLCNLAATRIYSIIKYHAWYMVHIKKMTLTFRKFFFFSNICLWCSCAANQKVSSEGAEDFFWRGLSSFTHKFLKCGQLHLQIFWSCVCVFWSFVCNGEVAQ